MAIGTRASQALRGLVGADAPLTGKIFVANAAVVLAVLAGALVMLSLAARATADASLDRGLEQTRRHVVTLLAERERTLAGRALVFVQSPTFRALVLSQSPSDLLDQATEAVERTGADWVQITDAEGVRLAKSDEPTAPSVSLAGSALIAGALGGEPTAGFGASGDTLLFQATGVPIIGTTSVSGVLMATVSVDSSFVAAVKEATGSDIIFYVIDTANATRVSSTTLPATAELHAIVEQAVRSANLLEDTVMARREVRLDERGFLAQAQLVRSAGGDVLGGFALLRSRDAELAPFHRLRRWILTAGILGLALAFPLSYAIARRITRPVLELVDATKRIASGDYSRDVPVRSSDEVGTLADAVHSLQLELRDKQSLVDFLLTSQELARHAPNGAGEPSGRAAPGGPLARGTVLGGRFAIDAVLGEGGTGVIYRAIDRELGETVAIKTLRPGVVADDPTALERLKSEIRLARRLTHRNIVRIHDLGEADGMHFITMELVAGTPLTTLIRGQGRLPVAGTVSVGKQLSRALQAAHDEGIVHRDIKPHNLMLQPDGVLKVLDFGVARLVRRTAAALTQVGMVVGTPEYMAPEQLLDEEVDARTDLYAMGVVLYECLTGKRPIDGDSVVTLIARILAERPVPPATVNPEVPPALSVVVMQLLARDRAERPSSARVVLQALEALA